MIKNLGLHFCCSIVVACLFSAGNAWAQTNIWTNSASGYWEQPFWSAGVLPGAGQTIVFTNAWQALAIGAETAAAYPESMQVDAIMVGAPSNSFNELLLNYAGYDVPLVVGSSAMYPFLGNLVVKTNSAMVILASALQVNNSLLAYNTERGAFSIGGTFSQGDFAKVTADWLHVGNIGPGVYNLTNGLVAVTNEFVGGNFPAVFNQFGGYNTSALELDANGKYYLYSGDFGGSVIFRQGTFTQADGSFRQLDGTFVGDLTFIGGNYMLQGGLFTSSTILLPAQYNYGASITGDFQQTGGTNFCQSVVAWGDNPREATAHYGSYTLANGSLLVSGTVQLDGDGSFTQSGGFQTNSGVGVTAEGGYSIPEIASFSLSGGLMMTPDFYVEGGNYAQSGGTNLVSGNLSLYGTIVPIVFPPANYPVGSFTLVSGLVTCSNASVVTDQAGSFNQTGGILQVSNLLAVSGRAAGYTLSGVGRLITRDISLNEGGTVHHSGGTVVNSGLITFAEGRWFANTNETDLGQLVLGVGASNTVSSITLPSGPAVIRFGASTRIAWSNQAVLTIEGWNGSPAGGDRHQIIFGIGAAALTSLQLSHIQFHNPSGINGTSAATILSTGEIVPARLLGSQRISGGLVLSWPPGATLQTATNVSGPYSDVANSSPYTNYFTDPRRFFRLRD